MYTKRMVHYNGLLLVGSFMLFRRCFWSKMSKIKTKSIYCSWTLYGAQ